MQFRWTQTALRTLWWWTLDGKDAAAIAAHLGCARQTVQAMQRQLGLRLLQERQFWTNKEKAILRQDYSEMPTLELAKKLKRSPCSIYEMAAQLNVKKSHAFLSSLGRAKLSREGAPFRFRLGQAPWNKGLRHPKGWAPGRMAETQFKKGNIPQTWLPIGTISVDTEGYRRIKVREPREGEPSGTGNPKSWPLLHHWIWEQHHGPIPAGYKIAFKNQDRGNCDVTNLELLPEAEMMRRNSVHNLPQELARVIQLAGALRRKLRGIHEKGFGDAL